MKRTFAIILASLVAAALFALLVHAVLMVAHVSDPAATTVRGMTPRRIWATTVVALGLAGVIVGSMALVRAARRVGKNERNGAILALAAGIVAVINGGLNLAVATGGPGTGNGVIGGAAAFVLGLIGMALGGLALSRGRRTIHFWPFAKNAVAFPRMSRSMVTRANSARRRRISICSAVNSALRPEPRNLPARWAFTQFANVCSTIPRLRAASETRWPDSTRRTASCLNSSV